MLSVVIIAKTIAGLPVGPLVKKQLSDCTFYGQQKYSRPVLFKRFDKCYEEVINGKTSRLFKRDEQGVWKEVRKGERRSTVANGALVNVQRAGVKRIRASHKVVDTNGKR